MLLKFYGIWSLTMRTFDCYSFWFVNLFLSIILSRYETFHDKRNIFLGNDLDLWKSMCIRAFFQSSVNFSSHGVHNILIFRFYIYYYVTMYVSKYVHIHSLLETYFDIKRFSPNFSKDVSITSFVSHIHFFWWIMFRTFFLQLLKYMLDSRKERWTLSVSSLSLSSSNKENALEWMSCIRLFPLSEVAT